MITGYPSLDLSVLEGRLTAIRAGYLDELATAAIPTDLNVIISYVDELETRLSAARAGFLDNLDPRLVGRSLEGYALQMAQVIGNDAIYVTTLDITGRGVLVSVGMHRFGANSPRTGTLKLTIDGGGASEDEIFYTVANEYIDPHLVLMKGFASACKVEMKASSGYLDPPRYWGVALVE